MRRARPCALCAAPQLPWPQAVPGRPASPQPSFALRVPPSPSLARFLVSSLPQTRAQKGPGLLRAHLLRLRRCSPLPTVAVLASPPRRHAFALRHFLLLTFLPRDERGVAGGDKLKKAEKRIEFDCDWFPRMWSSTATGFGNSDISSFPSLQPPWGVGVRGSRFASSPARRLLSTAASRTVGSSFAERRVLIIRSLTP